MANPDIDPGLHYCHTCKYFTNWSPRKDDDPAQKCDKCGRRFPCGAMVCKHQDCQEWRALYGAVPATGPAEPDGSIEDIWDFT
jgi:hypothetical protein